MLKKCIKKGGHPTSKSDRVVKKGEYSPKKVSVKLGSRGRETQKSSSRKKKSDKKSNTPTLKQKEKKVASFPRGIVDDSRIYGTSDYSLLVAVKGTSFSSERPYHYYQIAKIIRRLFKDPKLIIDACSHIGCSTLNMATTYPTVKIVSIEIKKSVHDALLLNVAASGFSRRIRVVHDNCIPYLKKLDEDIKPDFINFDPPWGGPSYIKHKKIMLTLCNTVGRAVPIYDIFIELFEKEVTEAMTIKAPINFDMVLFVEKMGRGVEIRVYEIYEGPNECGVVYSFVVIRKDRNHSHK